MRAPCKIFIRTRAAMGWSVPVGSVGAIGMLPGIGASRLGAPAAGTPLLAFLQGIRGVGGTSSRAPVESTCQ
eukprot:12936051-Prorocentrum_lima.AAC.1